MVHRVGLIQIHAAAYVAAIESLQFDVTIPFSVQIFRSDHLLR